MDGGDVHDVPGNGQEGDESGDTIGGDPTWRWNLRDPLQTARLIRAGSECSTQTTDSNGSFRLRPRLGSSPDSTGLIMEKALGGKRRSSSLTLGPGSLGWTDVSDVSVSEFIRDSSGHRIEGTEEVIMHESIDSINLQTLSSSNRKKKRRRRRTKIVCAIGPTSRSVEKLVELLEAGMNVARLNFSHKDHEYHLETLQNIKKAVEIRKSHGVECHCAILMDTKGPEIRTGDLVNSESVELKMHQEFEICTDYSILGDNTRVACSYAELCESVHPGGRILIADGSISCLILRVNKDSVTVRVENDAILGERKNMNIPGVSIRLPGITEKDIYDIQNFALKYDVDIISGSFIRTAANVRALRECLGPKGRTIRVHAKIESVEALKNIHEIIAEADGVHVSRGDLGMELPLSKLFLAQKAVIRWANLAGKPVVTSTQMLDSMTTKPRPTNAECSDVANAVLDGTDCVMLSAETANGLYPRESVVTMASIIAEAERAIDYESHFALIREEVLGKDGNVPLMEALASSAVESAMDVAANLIVLISETGKLATLVAKYRPLARILVATGNPMTARQMSVSRGVSALLLDSDLLMDPTRAWIDIARYAILKQWVRPGDRAILLMSPIGLTEEKYAELKLKAHNSNRLVNCVEIRTVPEIDPETF